MYDDVVNESVPDDFLSFLEKADERLARSVQSDVQEPELQTEQADDQARKKA